MLGVGFTELLVVAVVLLVAVGPQRVPTLMRAAGRALREFRRATRELKDSIGWDDLMDEERARVGRRGSLGASQWRSPVGTQPALGSPESQAATEASRDHEAEESQAMTSELERVQPVSE